MEVLELDIFHEPLVVEILIRFWNLANWFFIPAIRAILVRDDGIGVLRKHEGIAALEVQLLQVVLHIVEDVLDGGPVNDVDPNAQDLMGPWVEEGSREANIEPVTVIFALIIVKALHQLRRVPVMLGGAAENRIPKHGVFFGVFPQLSAEQGCDLFRRQLHFVSIDCVDGNNSAILVHDYQNVIDIVVKAVFVQQAEHPRTVARVKGGKDQGESRRHRINLFLLFTERHVNLVRRILSHLFQRQPDSILGDLAAADEIGKGGNSDQRYQRKSDSQGQKLVSLAFEKKEAR